MRICTPTSRSNSLIIARPRRMTLSYYLVLPDEMKKHGLPKLHEDDKEFEKYSYAQSVLDNSSSTTLAYEKRAAGSPTSQWSPAILRLPPTLLFVGFLLGLITLSEVFIHLSPLRAPSTAAATFAWTYLPPAAVVFVDLVWDMYNLQLMLIQPWALLHRGPSPAEDAWLLDYRSLNYFSGIWYALRHKHWIIFLTYVGFWVSAAAGVVSTSLWTIQDLPRTWPADFVLTSHMDPASFAAGNFTSDQTYLNGYIGRQMFNLSRPRWTTADDIVLESFVPQSSSYLSGNSSVIQYADTTGYSAALNCDVASASYSGPPSNASFFQVAITAGTCNATYNVSNTLWTQSEIRNMVYYYGNVINHTCPGSSPLTVLTTASVENVAFTGSAAIACTPSYQQHTLSVTVPSSSSPLNMTLVSGSSLPFSYPGGDNAVKFINDNGLSISDWMPLVLHEPIYAFPNAHYEHFFLLLAIAGGVRQQDLMDAATLMNASQRVFSGVWAHFAQRDLLVTPPQDVTVGGSIEILDRSLTARPISVRVLQGTLIAMILVTLCVYVWCPSTSLPRDPSSLASLAVLLAASNEVEVAMDDTGRLNEGALKERLHNWKFNTAVAYNGFTIMAEREGQSDEDVPPVQSKKASYWNPILLHPFSQIILLVMTAATIVVLEVLYRDSASHEGLSSVSTFISTYSWSYVPPIYLAVLGLFMTAFSFQARTVAPFIAMYRAPQPAETSVTYNPVNHTSLGLLWHSIRYRNLIGIMCASILITIPLIKIAVAGVFIASSMPAFGTVQLALTGAFNATSIVDFQTLKGDGAFQEGQTFALSQIPSYGLPLSAWIAETEAVGTADLNQLPSWAQQNTTIVAPLPVMFAELTNCTVLAPGDYSTTIREYTHDTVGMGFAPNITGQGPSDCAIELDSMPPEPGYFGQLSAVATPCDAYALVYGHTAGSNYTDVTDMAVVYCSYNMTLATKNVTLRLTSGPELDFSIQSVQQTPAADVQAIDSLQDLAVNGITIHLFDATFSTSNKTQNFDGFMQVLTLQNATAPLDTYLNPEILVPTAQRLWSTFWATLADQNMRLSVDPGQDYTTAQVQYHKMRIVQRPLPRGW